MSLRSLDENSTSLEAKQQARKTKSLHFSLLILAGVATLSACAAIPASGPSRMAINESGLQTNKDEKNAVGVVEIDDYTLSVLATRASFSLQDYFGDYRPPATQPIGIGDAVQITVWEAAAGGLFSSSASEQGQVSSGSRTATIPNQVVGRDGSVSVPYAGRIKVAGRTQQQVQDIIIENLKGKAIEPQVLVSVASNVSNTVTVSGDVGSAARVPLTIRGDRLLDVIATAGGFRSPVYETFISLTRRNKTARVPIQTLLDKPSENIYARPGDVLIVEHTQQTFTVTGATGYNAVIPFGARAITLEEAIARSGGLQDNRADPEGIYVLRYETQKLASKYPYIPKVLLSEPTVPIVYHLNVRDPKAFFLERRFVIQDKDVLLVTNAPIIEAKKFIDIFQMTSSPLGPMMGAAAATGAL